MYITSFRKQVLPLLLIFIFACSFFQITIVNSAPNKEITVYLDGKALKFDQPPVNINGRVLVPMRNIFEALGATISWDGATQTVTAIKDEIAVALQIGNPTANKNNSPVPLDTPPIIINNRTMVPLRFVSETFGCNVEWNGDTQTIKILSAIKDNVNSFLIGSWSYDGFNGSIIDSSTGMITGSTYGGQWYKFNSDGTYRYIIAGSSLIITGACVVEGNYKLDGSRIVFYNSKETWFPKFTGPEYRNKPIDDKNYELSFDSENQSLRIDSFTFYRIKD